MNSTNSTTKPEEFVVNPVMSNFILMDKVSRNLTSLVKSQELNHSTQKELNEKFNKLIEINLKNNELLNHILKEQSDSADEGEILRLSGTVSPTTYTIINTIQDPGHPIKAFEFINDSVNTIYVGYNVVLTTLSVSTSEVTSNLNRFDAIPANESIEYRFNRNKIRNIHILAQKQSFRL